MKQEIPRELIDDRIEKIADKGTDMSDVDLYNLCFLNKLSEEDDTNNKSIQPTNEYCHSCGSKSTTKICRYCGF